MFTTRIIDSFVSHRRRRQTTLELANLSDHLLRDIGIARHDPRLRKRSR